MIFCIESIYGTSERGSRKNNIRLIIMISLGILVLSQKAEINHLHLAILNSEVIRLNVLVNHFRMLVQSLNTIEHL
jgi:hypothetical protein